jgi:putative ABC transport system permease protein
MIGLALVTFVSVLGAGLIGTARSDVREQISASYVVTAADGYGPVSTAAGRHLSATLPGSVVSSVREDQARVAGDAVPVDGVDPSTIARTYRFTWTAGGASSLADLDGDGAVVSRVFAEDHHLSVGSRVPMVSPSGERSSLTVTGVYDPPSLSPVLAPVVISQDAFDAAFPRPKDRYTFVSDASGGVPAIERALSAYPDTKVATAAGYAEIATSDLSTILNMLYVLLGLSVIVSIFGMVNTLVLAVHERTRELGMLRAVGMTRRQVRAMVRGEGVITALIGAALGIPLGIGIAALTTHALSEWGVALTIPSTLLWFVIVAIAVGVLAAVMPARRAARLDVLRALQYE